MEKLSRFKTIALFLNAQPGASIRSRPKRWATSVPRLDSQHAMCKMPIPPKKPPLPQPSYRGEEKMLAVEESTSYPINLRVYTLVFNSFGLFCLTGAFNKRFSQIITCSYIRKCCPRAFLVRIIDKLFLLRTFTNYNLPI